MQPFSGPGGREIISSNGGREPVWSRDGKELFYRRGHQIWVVAVESVPEFCAATPQLLFEGRFTSERAPSGSQSYDVSPDGQQFVMVVPDEQQTASLEVVLNWFEELKARVPTEP